MSDCEAGRMPKGTCGAKISRQTVLLCRKWIFEVRLVQELFISRIVQGWSEMQMFKRILFAATLVSSSAIAQEVDVNGKDFLSGAGDARLADIARQAASQGKRLVVTAPDYWQSKVASKLHAGASNIDVQMKEGFFENVLVRVDDGKAAAASTAAADKAAATKAENAKAEAARAENARIEAQRAEAERIEAQRAEAQRIQTAKEQADRAEAARIEAQRADAARAEAAKAEATRAEAAKAAAAKAQAEKDAANKLTTIKQRMQQNLSGGHEAEGTLTVAQLQKDDELFIDGPIRGVVRRDGARTHLFWLDGDLNLDRVELTPVADNHYHIVAPIRETATPTLRTKSVGGTIAGHVPPPTSAERKSLEQQYAEGKSVTQSLQARDLHSGDTVYIGISTAMIVRLQGTAYLRYWLDGDLSLSQPGLQKESSNVYKVISDTVR
jgi:hypothetical protein